MRKLLAAAASERPLVVVFEDVHWAEPVLLDLIEHLASDARGRAGRSSSRSPDPTCSTSGPASAATRRGWSWSRSAATTAALLVEHLVGDAGVAAGPDRSGCSRGAEGNPLFVEELVRMLVDERQLERDDSGLSAVRSSPLSLPPTIHALLAARLDRLEPGERAVIEPAR